MHRALLSSAGLLALIVPVPSSAAPPADSIEYALADTLLQLKLDLVLESCGEPSISPRDLGEPFLLKPTLTVTPEARGSLTAENRFRVSGADLASWWTKRDVALALNDNGTLKSVGVTSENRGPAIIGNIIKLGTAAATLGLVPFLSGPAIPPPPQCTPTDPESCSVSPVCRSAPTLCRW